MDFPRLKGAVKLGAFIRPMLASSSKQPVNDSKWIAEIKYDGYRAIATTGNKVELSSRNGISFLKSFPKLAAELSKLDFNSVLDGEVVVMDLATGLPSFNALQNYDPRSKSPIYFYVFDCLSYRGKDLRDRPLIERKKVLQSLFNCEGLIRYCDHVGGDSITALFDQVKSLKLEGIICKRIDSKYREGERSKDWVKVKNYQEKDFFILGYGTEQFSLLLGEAYNGKLLYRGEVGTGWTEKVRTNTLKLLNASPASPSAYLHRLPKIPAKWVTPQYMCRVKFLDYTRDGQVRHSVFVKVL